MPATSPSSAKPVSPCSVSPSASRSPASPPRASSPATSPSSTNSSPATSSRAETVYSYLRSIPRGKVVTYGQIATHLGNPHLARVVGNILHHNPDPDRTPCFRVVNSQGRLAPNFAIDGPEEQQRRLEADGIEVHNLHVDLDKYQYHPG